MIGSPDLLAFTAAEGFGEDEEDPEGLPEELSVPLLAPSHPWSSAAQFRRDFILVAEFSEQVGPKPVLTIPDDPRVVGSFDLNHFSVRIMSVDYQASGPSQSPPVSPGPRLSFSEDSKVILGDSAEDAFAYVHHLTLYDLEARGMVRPFCMAYVCSDQDKLMENLPELAAGFSLASDSLKTGNRQAFSMELQRKLQELEYTRLTLRQEAGLPHATNGVAEARGGGGGDELEATERSIITHRDLLRQVTSYPNRKLKQPDFLPYDPADVLADPLALAPAEPPEPPPPPAAPPRSEEGLKPLQELCNAYFLSLMKEQLADTERRLRGDRSVLRHAQVTRSLSRKLTLTNFLFELWRPEDGEELEEEEEGREDGGGEQQRAAAAAAAGRRSAEPMSLESFYSCVEEIPIKMVAAETSDPVVATEMAGSVSSGDSIEVLGTEKSYRTQHAEATADGRAESAGGPPDACLRRAASEANTRRARACARRANSEDSIEVLSTTDSIFPDDLTAITEEEAEQQSLGNGLPEEEEEEEEDERPGQCTPGEKGEEPSAVPPVQEDEERRAEDECVRRDHEDEGPDGLEGREGPSSALPGVGGAESPLRQPEAPRVAVAAAARAEAERWPPPCPPSRLLSVDEASDCTSFSSDAPSPLQRSRAERKRRRKAGLRALRFLKHNSFSQHAVFCLLSGRPLVVIGGDEGVVRKLVDALSLFLPAPGADGKAVMACLSVPLQLSDLLTWRLIGIHRLPSGSSSSVIHSLTRYSRYLALLDLDQKTLRCPPYAGSLLSRLAEPHTSISRGATYLLHLESCLTALANQALLYTLNPAHAAPHSRHAAARARGDDLLLTRGFCSSEDDLSVMHFLSDLIKQHHAGRGPPALRFSYSPLVLHKNTSAA